MHFALIKFILKSLSEKIIFIFSMDENAKEYIFDIF